MPSAALIVALLAPPSIAAALPDLAASTKAPGAHAASLNASPTAPWRQARLTLWGAQVRWDEAWRGFVTHETADRAVVPVWERFETPSTDAAAPAPSYVVMREMDCGRRAWRTTGVVSFPQPNLEGDARFEPSSEAWRSAADGGEEVGSIYGSVCRR